MEPRLDQLGADGVLAHRKSLPTLGTAFERLALKAGTTYYSSRRQPSDRQRRDQIDLVNKEMKGSKDPRAQFGRHAAQYATSRSHGGGASLAMLTEWARPRFMDFVLDIATGAGFAAFALAPQAEVVVATDITPEMLAQARQLAESRGLRDVRFAFSSAEHLAFHNDSFDIVTCRAAAHHFVDVPTFLAEAHRVCKEGGRMLLIDTTAPEDEALSCLMNDWERRRDPSHIHNYSPSQWRALLCRQGFKVLRMAMVKTELEFSDWVRRSGTPPEEVAVLRREFETASPKAAAAFAIRLVGDALPFSWDTAVIEARRLSRGAQE